MVEAVAVQVTAAAATAAVQAGGVAVSPMAEVQGEGVAEASEETAAIRVMVVKVVRDSVRRVPACSSTDRRVVTEALP